MKLTCNFKVPNFNISKYKSDLTKQLANQLTKSAQAWLATIGNVPVWTGASRASFAPLASKVGYNIMLGAEFNHKAPIKAPINAAFQFGTGEGTFSVLPDSGIYSFGYATRLQHLIINENYDARIWGFRLTSPGPYHFQAYGLRMFWQSLEGFKLPDLRKYVKWTKK